MTHAKRSYTLVLMLFSLFVVQSASAAGIPRDVSLAPLVKQVSPAVVNISTRGTIQVENNPMMQDPFFRRFFNMPNQPTERQTGSLGSGVIIDARNGYILTNNHVIENADEIMIGLVDQRELKAELIGADSESDLAVLKVEADELIALPFGNSEQLDVGDYVLAIGNPFGLGGTVTSGIVSAKGRSGLNIESYEDFIQTDASINRGNSGGALINLQGELVGINTAILGPGGGNVGIGFAIPASMVKAVYTQILEYGSVQRGLLGIQGQPLTRDLADYLGLDRISGALIRDVEPDSAADQAGLEEYDLITGIDGERIDDFNQLRNRIGLKRPGEEIEIEYLRDGKRRNTTAELGARDALAQRSSSSQNTDEPAGLSGLQLMPIPRNHPLFGDVDGVMVNAVESGSNAARVGIQRGDIITEINRKPVKSIDDVTKILDKGERYMVKARRGEGSYIVVLS